MNLAAPAAAMQPFMDSEIVVVPHTRAAEIAAPVRLPACVREAAPLEAGGGLGDDAGADNAWSVSIPLAAIPAGVEIVRGARIEPDAAARRPCLHVRKAAANGGLLHLECTARERR